MQIIQLFFSLALVPVLTFITAAIMFSSFLFFFFFKNPNHVILHQLIFKPQHNYITASIPQIKLSNSPNLVLELMIKYPDRPDLSSTINHPYLIQLHNSSSCFHEIAFFPIYRSPIVRFFHSILSLPKIILSGVEYQQNFFKFTSQSFPSSISLYPPIPLFKASLKVTQETSLIYNYPISISAAALLVSLLFSFAFSLLFCSIIYYFGVPKFVSRFYTAKKDNYDVDACEDEEDLHLEYLFSKSDVPLLKNSNLK